MIMPNLTEASYMLQLPYREKYDEAYIRNILIRLAELGIRRTALTGVSFREDEIGFYFYDAQTRKFASYFNKKLPSSYHGTGDIFASVVTGAYMRGLSMEETLKTAVDYVLECIQCTVADKNSRSYGVNFEEALPFLIRRLESRK